MAPVNNRKKTVKRNSRDASKQRLGAVGGLRKDRKVHTLQQQNASSELARDINRDIVLELLRTRQPISRVELSVLSGLQRSTVSLIVEDLLKEKWITEGASIKTARGRRPTMLSLNEDLVILVADIRPSQAIVALIDLNARFLTREVVPLSMDPAVGVTALIERMQQLRKEFPNKIFEGIGLSMPGRVNPDTQQLILAPNLRWKQYDTRARLQQEMQLQVEMDNAANACLLSELWFGRLAGVRNAVLITISEGLGAAIYAEGQIVLGGGGLAGEFGHIPIDESGPRCGCGLNGCWEMFASSRAALRYYSETKAKQPVTNIQELIGLAMERQPHAIEALSKQAEFIGRGLRLITAALSPDMILFAGDITASWSISGPIVESAIAKRMLAGAPPKIVPIGDGELARLRGAAALVLQRHTGYYRSLRPNSGQHIDSQQQHGSRVSRHQISESR